MYFAVIGDMVDSRKMIERSKTQNLLKSTLDDVNTAFANDLAANFTITLGDEFQGLFHRGDNLLRIVYAIINAMEQEDVKLRFGIGIGDINTDINPKLAIGADGPAFHYARDAIEAIKTIESKNTQIITGIRLQSGKQGEYEQSLNTIFSLCTFIRGKWTKRQREIAHCMVQTGNVQTKAAAALGITQSSVHKSLTNSGYYTFINAWESAQEGIASHWGGQNV